MSFQKATFFTFLFSSCCPQCFYVFLFRLHQSQRFFFCLFSVPSIILRIYIIFSYFDRARTSMTCMCVFLFFRLYGAYEVRKLEAELSDLRRVFHCCKSAVVRQWGHHLAPELTPTSAQRFRFSSYCCSHDHYGSEGVISVFFLLVWMRRSEQPVAETTVLTWKNCKSSTWSFFQQKNSALLGSSFELLLKKEKVKVLFSSRSSLVAGAFFVVVESKTNKQTVKKKKKANC